MTYLGKQIWVENATTLFSFMTFLRGYTTIRNYNPVSLPKLRDVEGDLGMRAGLKGRLPCRGQSFVYFQICIVHMHLLPALKILISSWLYLKITTIAKALDRGENLPLSAKNDKNEADKPYSRRPSKSGPRAECLFLLGRFTKPTLSQNLTHAK